MCWKLLWVCHKSEEVGLRWHYVTELYGSESGAAGPGLRARPSLPGKCHSLTTIDNATSYVNKTPDRDRRIH